MRRLNVFIIILFLTVYGYGQNGVDTKTATDAKTETKTTGETKTTADTTTGTVTTDTKTGEGTGEKKTTDENGIQKLPEGYGNLTWGMYVSEARDKIAGAIVYTDDKRVIVSKDGELEYRYGFFYIDPTLVEEEIPVTAAEKKPGDETGGTAADTTTGTVTGDEKTGEKTGTAPEKKDEGRLFYVSLNFPYLDKDTVYNKIKKKYGKHTGDNIKENQGAIAWDGGDTIVIMWVDNYKKRPYCRRVIYISKKISRELNEYTAKIFNKTELDLIKKINP